MIIYVDKNGKEIEKVERSTYTYVDKNTGKVLKVDGPKDKKRPVLKAVEPAPKEEKPVVEAKPTTKKITKPTTKKITKPVAQKTAKSASNKKSADKKKYVRKTITKKESSNK